jgi:sporulation protein YlmC with PRC-barrel domain
VTRLTETLGRKVVGVADATSLGTVSGFVVRPDEPRLAALRLRRAGGRGALLPWGRVRTVGADAVMAQPAADDSGNGTGARGDGASSGDLGRQAVKHGEVLGKRVLTEFGEEIGEVTDAEFDPESGALLNFTVEGGSAADGPLDAGRMTGLGSYALVLRAG